MNSGDRSQGDVSTAFRRQLGTILFVACPILAVILGVGTGLPDVYRSVGVIRIDQGIRGDDRAMDTYAEYYVETLAGRVFSAENLAAWVEEFELYPDESGWTESRRMNELWSNIDTSIITTPVIDPVSGREREVVTGFNVSYRNRSPMDAYEVANAATQAFLAENRRSLQARGQEQIDHFRQQSAVHRSEIAEVETRIAEFKELNSRKLPELLAVNMNSLERIEREIDETQVEIDNLEQQRVILQASLDQVSSTPDAAVEELAELQSEYVRLSSVYLDTHPNVVSVRRQIDSISRSVDSAAAIPILREQQVQLSNSLAEALERYSDDHPDVKELRASIEGLDASIASLQREAGSRIISDRPATNEAYIQLDTQIKAIDAQIDGWNDHIAELRRKRDEYEEAFTQTPQVEREFMELSRDLETAKGLYAETQRELQRAELNFAMTTNSAGEVLMLAQAASVPSAPAWPPRSAITALGFVLAASFGLGIATLREVSSGSIRSSADVFDLCGAPPISLIPVLYNSRRRWKRRVFTLLFASAVACVGVVSFLGARFL
jgi:uncharacterized protein involved in exopolysaccharide biosynthesis